MAKNTLQDFTYIFRRFPAVKLAYLFGSRASGAAGPLSDYDFAVYCDGVSGRALSDLRLQLITELSRALGTDRIDVVLLNTTAAPELKYQIISAGRLLYAIEPFQVLVEPKIFSTYFDFRQTLRRYALTKA